MSDKHPGPADLVYSPPDGRFSGIVVGPWFIERGEAVDRIRELEAENARLSSQLMEQEQALDLSRAEAAVLREVLIIFANAAEEQAAGDYDAAVQTRKQAYMALGAALSPGAAEKHLERDRLMEAALRYYSDEGNWDRVSGMSVRQPRTTQALSVLAEGERSQGSEQR